MSDGEAVPLRPKCYKVLEYLVRHAGVLVSKSELLDAVWPDVVVTEDSLVQCLIEIRRALNDDDRQMIKTIPKRGYLLDVEVEPLDQAALQDQSYLEKRFFSGRKPSLWSAGAFALLAIALGVTWSVINAERQTIAAPVAAFEPDPQSIAVLPFVNFTSSAEQGQVADELAESVLFQLSRSPDLTVISRTSSFAFKDQSVDIPTIARRLQVASVLEGSMFIEGGLVRLSIRLVDTRTAALRWSREYQSTLNNLHDVPIVMANDIAAALEVGQISPDVSAPARDSPAYLNYSQGKLFYSRRSEGDLANALERFQAASELAPEWAKPLAAMASTLHVMTFYGEISSADADPWRQTLLEQALRLNPNQPEALIRQSCYLWQAGNFAQSREYYDRALHYGRNNALVHAIAAGDARNRHDMEKAIHLMQRAVQLDPLSSSHHVNLAWFLLEEQQYDASREHFGMASQLNLELADTIHEQYMRIAILQGDIREALVWNDKLPIGPARDQGEAMIAFSQGNYAASEAAIERLEQTRDGWVTSILLAEVFGYRGENAKALEKLQRAAEQLIIEKGVHGFDQDLVNLLRSPFIKDVLFDPRSADLQRLVASNTGLEAYPD